jgi:periplasmic divalent cation tolerance protein
VSAPAEGAAVIWCPFPDEDTAAAAAGVLLDEGLVACANILPSVRSLFVWQGAREEAHEAAALFKTRAQLLDAALARLGAIHPYDTPAAVGWHCDAAPATLEWLGGVGGIGGMAGQGAERSR